MMIRKKSVGILTMHRVQNYGSILQTYALYHILTLEGYACEIIDYMYPNEFHSNGVEKKYTSFWTRRYKQLLFFLLYRNRLQKKRFNIFCGKYLSFSQFYSSQKELFAAPPKYDVYITGSDQVWNPFCMKGDSAFFLDFSPKYSHRVSYASSFSVLSIPQKYKMPYKQYLLSYTSISVREDAGVEIVKDLIGVTPKVVCDPTLLLTKKDYKLLSDESCVSVKGDYILVYALTYAYNPYPQIDNLIQKVKSQTGLQVIYLHSNSVEHYHFCSSITSAGPCEFLKLLMNAKFVITSSFHGTSFAINFGIPFYAIIPEMSGNDSRILSLLKRLGLEDRAVCTNALLPNTLQLDIDFSDSHKKLDEFRKESIEFLYKSLL